MIDWLLKRLTPYRASVERWTSLASATQAVWEAHVDPALSRLERLRSYYQADYQDLSRLIREMGDYFAEDLPGDTDRPIAVSWRRLELEYKDLELILSSVFRRHFGNLPVTWFPVFAPLDEPYGVGFKVAEGPWPELKNIPPDGMFLTSRGRLGVDHGHLLKMGLDKATFLEKGIPLLRRTKPLHIVYDGPLWYIYFDLPFHAGFQFAHLPPEREITCEFLFSPVGSRFDFIPADERPVDMSSLSCTWEIESTTHFFPLLPDRRWHMDWRLPEGLPWLPLDCIVAGVEGDSAYPCVLLADQVDRPWGFALSQGQMQLASSGSEPHFTPEWHAHLSSSGQAETRVALGTDRIGSDDFFKLHMSATECADTAQFQARTGNIASSIEPCTDTVLPFYPINGSLSKSTSQNATVAFRKDMRLDQYMRFDDVPADYCPLDAQPGGYLYA